MSYKILDNALPDILLNSLLMQFPSNDWRHWYQWDTSTSRKKGTKSPHDLPEAANSAIDGMIEVIGSEFGDWVGRSTGPDRDLHGAGLALMDDGDFVNVHTDAEWHPMLAWQRTHSAILYLNTCDSGFLTFNDTSPQHAIIAAIKPRRNRLVIFETQGQFHAVTECRESRKSLSLFLWKPVGISQEGKTCTSQFTNLLPVITQSTLVNR